LAISSEQKKRMMYLMVLGRRIEETITMLFKEGRMRGHHHPGVGVEGVHVGCCWDLVPEEDYIVPQHRGKLPELMMGLELKDLMAGYFNKKEGLGGGRVPTGSHMYGDIGPISTRRKGLEGEESPPVHTCMAT
jgi:TPP-dependent pyruvate/acetoin dehydrogenase alpha subunit